MTSGITVTRRFRVQQKRRGRKALEPGGSVERGTTARVPRVARLMALAIRFNQLLRDGVVADQAELARLGHVSRAWLTQIMNLVNLAPDVQEQILHLAPTVHGRDPVSERQLRPMAAQVDWQTQRLLWQQQDALFR